MLSPVLASFGFREDKCTLLAFGSGLINNTWLLGYDGRQYILQRISQQVFKNPQEIAGNIDLISDYLQQQAPGYYFVKPVKSIYGETLVYAEDLGYFRLFPFAEGSHTIDVVTSTHEAYEAALQFGRFTKTLSSFDAGRLNITLPDFHDLDLRYRQFEDALQTASGERKEKATELGAYLELQSNIVKKYNAIRIDPAFKKRVTHHDTKISNVLFDDSNNGLCVIDLDTVMPGYFISDVGDMMRTYLSPVSEEENDITKIGIRDDYFMAIAKGYLAEMNHELSETEKEHFVFAGRFMIYMQALRFLTDYLNNDIYYGQKYEGHNFVRARNQAILLQQLTAKEASLQEMALRISCLC